MKKVMFALCFMVGGIVAVTAQDQSQSTMGQQDRERIQVTELPDEVKRSLEGQEYRGWLISGAFKAQHDQSSSESDPTSTDATSQENAENANATETEKQEHFIVELKNGAETKTVRFDSEGEIVEGMEGDQNSQMNQSETESSTPQPDQSQSSQSADPSQSESTGTPTGESSDTETQSEKSTETDTKSEQSTETETQTDQSKANEPK